MKQLLLLLFFSFFFNIQTSFGLENSRYDTHNNANLPIDFDVDCASGVETTTFCYGNNETETLTFTSTTGDPVIIEFLAGSIESGFDEITIYDGNDNSGNVLFTGDNGGDLAGIIAQSSGDSIFIEIDSDGSVSCDSSTTFTEWNIEFRCVTCIAATANYDIVSDCANGEQFFVNVNLTDIGDAESIEISDDQGSELVTTTETGVFSFGPFANGTDVNITVADADDVNCILMSGTLSQAFCPDQECSIVNAGEDQVAGCGGESSANLSATFMTSALTGFSSDYIISNLNCPLSNLEGTPTALNIDDRWSAAIDIGFDFEFFGITYSQLLVGANGLISFNIEDAGGFCPWSFEPDELLPTPDLPVNTVHGAYHDIDPSIGGQIEFTIVGAAPQRQFKVSFVHVPHFSCNDLLTTSQIILYESSNVIDVIVSEKPTCQTWNDGLAIVGIQNSVGDTAFTPPGRNTGNWEVLEQELWRFTPDGEPNYVFEWFDEDGNSLGNDTDISVSPTETTVYTATVTYTDANGISNTVSDDVTVTFVNNPPMPGMPMDIEACGDASGFAEFNLTVQDEDIIDGQMDVNVSYYETLEDAESQMNEITNPAAYTNTSNPQTIFFTLSTNESAECFSTGSFEIQTFAAPMPGVPNDITSCTEDINDAVFDLTSQDELIINSQTDVSVTYYLTSEDAENNENEILAPEAFTNTSNPQTLFFRLQLDTSENCFNTGSFQVQAFEIPTINTVEDIVNCSDAQGNVESFDLTLQDEAILSGQTGLNLGYFESLADAENNINQIENVTAYTNIANPQTIYFRLEQQESSECFSIGSFDLIVITFDTSLVNFDQGCNGDNFEITISPINNSFDPNTVTYEWFGPVGANLDNNTSPTFIATVDGEYVVEITTAEGCVYSIATDVLNANCIFPQGISPNGDSLNDTFDLRAFNVLRLEIFNRNGRSVYTRENYTNEWIGQSSNGELPVGTYFYVAQLENNETRNGWVYIQR